MKFNKSLATNLFAMVMILFSFVPTLHVTVANILLYSGLFALSGAITNQLAIHMLFEKVPFLYGSGVIPLRFEAFKQSIKDLMMEQFFTKQQLDSFFAKEEKKIDLTPIIEQTDFTPAFEALSKTVMESPFGGMLGMFGGEKAIEGLKEPFNEKMKSAVSKITSMPQFGQNLQEHLKASPLSEDILASVEKVIDQRLTELTPQMVKEMVQKIIKEHLEWLVVWGGIFGGVIGFVSSFLI